MKYFFAGALGLIVAGALVLIRGLWALARYEEERDREHEDF